MTVGYGWYYPSVTQKNYQGVDWDWTSDAPAQGPGVYVSCVKVPTFFGLSSINVAAYTGAFWGLAFPVISNLPGTGTRRTGSEGDETCWEYYEYWYDQNGTYHENVLESWCETDAET